VNKSEIRKKIFETRKQIGCKNFYIDSKKILKILKNKKNINRIVGGYYPYNYEINTIKILEKLEKQKYQISLPKIKKNSQMDFFHWSTKDPLIINKYGIPEPTSEKVLFPDILLVPIVAFDKFLNRVGYGGGFYDRYIEKLRKRKKIITIGLAYSFQQVKEVPINKYDIKLDFVVTEK
tara:strand:- start:202 stop:735 length:534 start_codon:yes stop_codon:yes gene_type:complete